MDYKLPIFSVIITLGFFTHSEGAGRDSNVSADTLIITTLLDPPYFMEVSDNTGLQYEGFIVDLWNELNSAMTNKYDKFMFQPMKTDQFDSELKNDHLDKMLGQVFRGEADVAFSLLTDINTKHSELISLTKPFLVEPTAVLLKKDLNISSIQQLMNNPQVKYGFVVWSQTFANFRKLRDPFARQLREAMEESSFVDSNDLGAARAATEDYAFITEKGVADYKALHNCDLTSFVLDLVPPSRYKIALEKQSRFKADFDKAIRSVKRSGVITQLYDKWWRPGQCDANQTDTDVISGDITSGGTYGEFFCGASGDEVISSMGESYSGETPQAEGEPQSGGIPDSGCPKNDVAIVMTFVMSAVVVLRLF